MALRWAKTIDGLYNNVLETDWVDLNIFFFFGSLFVVWISDLLFPNPIEETHISHCIYSPGNAISLRIVLPLKVSLANVSFALEANNVLAVPNKAARQ